MDKPVVFSESARQHLDAIFDYLEEHFSQVAAGNFIENVLQSIQKIARYPEMYPVSKMDIHVHFYRMDNNRRIFYEITDLEIRVLAIFDTRQDPQKSPY